MAKSPQNVVTLDMDSEEPTLPTPRFDEVAARMARPVEPLSDEIAYIHPGHATSPGSRKGSWLLALAFGVLLAAGAMAISITAYRRNRLVSTQPSQSLAAVAEATKIEINQDHRPKQSLSINVPVRPPHKRHSQSARPVFDGRPRARMVSSYVIR